MTIPQDQRQAWLALYMIPGLGNVVLRRLFEKFLDVKAILEAGFFDLMGVEGLSEGDRPENFGSWTAGTGRS